MTAALARSAYDPSETIIRDPQQSEYLVNKRVFADGAILETEMRSIFDKLWLYVGHGSEIPQPGDFLTRRVGGRPLLFVRGDDGEVRAFLNSCTHNGSTVCRARTGNRKHFTCAYHGWTFDRNGALVEVPGEAAYGGGFYKGDHGLIPVASFDEYAGFYFVSFAKRDDLIPFLAGATEYLDLMNAGSAAGMHVIPGTHLYGSRANWKLQMLNVLDGSHFMPTHITYLQYLQSRGTEMKGMGEFHETPLGNGHTVFEYEAPWGRPYGKVDPSWDDSVKAEVEASRFALFERLGPEAGDRVARKNRNLCIFPSLIINDIVGITIRVLEPVTVDYVEVSAHELAPVGDSEALASLRRNHFLTFLGPGGFATPDDIEGMEASQRGFATWRDAPWINYSKGMAARDDRNFITPGDSDALARHFFDYWEECVRPIAARATA